jgi:hypothetical protein
MYEFLNPPNLEKDVALDSTISVNIVGNDIIFSTVSITINGEDAYDGTTGFSTEYSGINSSFTFLPLGSIFGENAYRIIIDPTSDLTGSETFNVYATVNTTTTPRTTSWQFTTLPISSWSFTIEDYVAPWIENNSPTSLSCLTDVNISVDVLDDFGISDIKIYVNSNNAFDFPNVFYPHYNGTNSSITAISDGYRIVIDPDNLEMGVDYTVLVVAEDISGNIANLSWMFRTLSDYAPLIENNSPTSLFCLTDVNISVDVLDDFGISDIKIYVNSNSAFDFPNVFYTHYDGINSSITTIPDGYHIVIDPDNLEPDVTYTVLVVAEDTNGSLSSLSWVFRTSPELYNILYLANINGLYAIEQRNLVGECQSQLRLVLSTSTTPSLPTNRMSNIHGIKNGPNSYLALSLGLSGAVNPIIADQYGAIIVKNESELTSYAQNFDVAKAQITDNGILYYINKTLNTIDCYHGAIDGYSDLDYFYNSSSTPSILPGEILSLFVLNGEANKLYVGTELGLTVIESNDYDIDGYSVGDEATGISKTYSIASGSGTHKIIGGNSPEVRDVVYMNGIILVVTDDGITQILEEENRKIYFMDSSNLPSTTIRKITNS